MLDVFISGLINGNSYVLIAIGMSLIFGVANLVNFAHGSIFAIGAMLGWWFVVVLHWPLWATLLGTIIITGVLGVLIELFCVRPLSSAPPIATLLSTLAISFVLDYSSQLIFSPDTRRFPSLLPTANLQLGGLRIGTLDITILAVSIVSVGLLWLFLRYTQLGRAIRATAQDRDAALQMGVPVGLVQSLTFALASALGGLAGVLIGMYYSSVSPTNGFNAGLEGFAAATLGGLGSLPGAVVGGLVLGIVESFGVSWFGDAVRQFITFAVLIGVLWIRPGGLFGAFNAITSEPMTGTFFGSGKLIKLKVWQIALLVAVFGILLPLWGNAYALQIGTLAAIFAILALSLTLIAGTAGQISIGQAGPFAIGAYVSALLTRDHGWSFWLALPVAGILAALINTIIMAPVLKLRGHYVAIATLGAGAMIAAMLLSFNWLTYGPLGVSNIPPPVIFGQNVDSPVTFYILAFVVLLLVTALVARLQRSHLGRAWYAIREDEIASQSSGIPLADYKSLVFALGGFIAGLGGSLLAHNYTFISPDIFNITISTLALTIVVLGGIGSALGAVIGAVILVGAPELFRPLQDIRYLGYGLLLLLLIRFRPQGIWGKQ
ncbi:ABC transporter permease [Ktedonosporobacter rubrisoli]|uniref:ABC transporter permease n=1 Tax=Ktedonosporobacter rubrisoli TaxID=2509675 RepID=A0A4P6JYY7_KTERU|nr:ABC transporter permease [Ktedonosporobacter rubrisoli]QBD80795.1 ABC transporter permease [Ktedonosporobacter rubrisoli]